MKEVFCLRCNNKEHFTVLIQMKVNSGIESPELMLQKATNVLLNTIICEECSYYMHYDANENLVSSFKDLTKEVNNESIVKSLKQIDRSKLAELLKTLTKEET